MLLKINKERKQCRGNPKNANFIELVLFKDKERMVSPEIAKTESKDEDTLEDCHHSQGTHKQHSSF